MTDQNNHYRAHGDFGGLLCEFGKSQFSGTGLTKEIPCGFKHLFSCVVTPIATINYPETYFSDLEVEGVGAAGTVTVTRKCDARVASFAIDNGQVDASLLTETPLIVAQRNMKITQVEWFHGTGWKQGTPSLLLGSPSDADAYLASALGLISNPTSANQTTTITTFTLASVSDGGVIVASTTGTSDASLTETESRTTTATGTASSTASTTETISRTSTDTASFTVTTTATDTLTATGTDTKTDSLSKSTTDTATESKTTTQTTTGTGTASVTDTLTSSATTTDTASLTLTTTVTAGGGDNDPSDMCITISYITPTVGLWFSYMLLGTY